MILTPKDLEETIHIHVDPEGETIGPVNIEIHGGTLRMGQLKITCLGATPGVIIDGGGADINLLSFPDPRPEYLGIDGQWHWKENKQ